MAVVIMATEDIILEQAAKLLTYAGETIRELVIDGRADPFVFTEEHADVLADAYEDLYTGATLLDIPHSLLPLPGDEDEDEEETETEETETPTQRGKHEAQ